MALASETSLGAARIGSFQYMTAAATPSLYRNGKVLTRRDRDGSDDDWDRGQRETRDKNGRASGRDSV